MAVIQVSLTVHLSDVMAVSVNPLSIPNVSHFHIPPHTHTDNFLLLRE